MRSTPVAYGLLLAGLVSLVVAVLYFFGILQFLVSDPHATRHTTHAILFGVLAVACFIGFNFARQKA